MILIAALCGATIGLLRVPAALKPNASPDLVARSATTAAADVMYRLAVWVPEASLRAGYGDVLRPTPREESAVARFELLALPAESADPVASHRLGIIYGERGYPDQAQAMFAQAVASGAVDTDVCLALSLVYSDERITPEDARRVTPLLARQPRWWALKTGARLADRIGAAPTAKYLRTEAHRELTQFALTCGAVAAACGALLVVGVGSLLFMVLKYLFTRERPKAPWPVRMPLLSWLDVLDVSALVMFCGALGLAARGALGLGDAQTWAGASFRVAHEALVVVPALGLIIHRLRGGRSGLLLTLGVDFQGFGRHVARGIIGAGLALAAVLVALSLTMPAALLGFATVVKAMVPNVLDLLLVLLIAPIAEELIYRGYVLQALWQKLRPLPAAALSALLFAGSHLVITPVGFGAIFAVGLVSAYVFRWSRSLVACVVLHVSYNAVVLATTLLARW